MPSNPINDVRIVVAGRELSNWQSYTIESALFTDADAFTFTVANPNGELSKVFSKFDSVQVLVDGTVQMTGFIDDINLRTDPDSGSTLELIGRDKFGQLIDVSADAQTFTKLDLGQIAIKLSQPFVEEWIFDNELNRAKLQRAKRKTAQFAPPTAQDKADARRKRIMEVLLPKGATAAQRKAALEKLHASNRAAAAADASKVVSLKKAKATLAKIRAEIFPRVKVEPGDSPLELIKRHADRADLMVWMAADGKGVIARPNYDQAPSYSLYHYPLTNPDRILNNVLSANIAISGREQFATYTIAGHSANTSVTFGPGSTHELSSTDSAIPLQRTKIINGRGQNKQQTKKELLRDIQQRQFEALQLSYTVPGHSQNEILWQADTIVDVDDQVNGQQGNFYLVTRRFVGDEEGQRTELELRPKGVFLP